jgi:uroporphyrinogen decarboxylase
MNSRQRVFTTLAHQEPDRVPWNLRPSAEIENRWREQRGDPNLDFAAHFGYDVRYVSIPLPRLPELQADPRWNPRPDADAVTKCREKTRALQAEGVAVCGGYACGVFEQAKKWLGDAQALTMPVDDPRRLRTELERITAWKMDVYGAYAQAGVDIVWIGDDLGAQHSLIMSPVQYRQWYRPCHVQIVESLRKLREHVHIAFHCCGYVTALVPDLIEMGIDILEAVQPECMDLAFLKREFGRDISFWGGIGTQSTLAKSSRAELFEGVRKTLELMAPGGGYIAAPAHTLTEEVPWETVVAFHEAMQRYGAYPYPGSELAAARTLA